MEREKSFSSRDEMKKYLVQNEIQYLFEVSHTYTFYIILFKQKIYTN